MMHKRTLKTNIEWWHDTGLSEWIEVNVLGNDNGIISQTAQDMTYAILNHASQNGFKFPDPRNITDEDYLNLVKKHMTLDRSDFDADHSQDPVRQS
jgi:hypothetical protein